MKLQRTSASLLAAILMVIMKSECREKGLSIEEIKIGVDRAVRLDRLRQILHEDQIPLQPRRVHQAIDLTTAIVNYYKKRPINIHSLTIIVPGTLYTFNRYIKVTDDGVIGTFSKSPYIRLLFKSVGHGYVLIQGSASKKYICMDRYTGEVYASDIKAYECVFREMHPKHHKFVYKAFIHRHHKHNWYLAMDSHGKMINGKESDEHKDSVRFIKKHGPLKVINRTGM
eukprot:Seg1668.9 transcript_id=Seg1668.9/GoldUCD/mRNA.D3Y31 product="Fibroblast growth factor 13" protein_id=Seg1668.9/GoldUCD/D3Y31